MITPPIPPSESRKLFFSDLCWENQMRFLEVKVTTVWSPLHIGVETGSLVHWYLNIKTTFHSWDKYFLILIYYFLKNYFWIKVDSIVLKSFVFMIVNTQWVFLVCFTEKLIHWDSSVVVEKEFNFHMASQVVGQEIILKSEFSWKAQRLG